jgi:hypothetical protein
MVLARMIADKVWSIAVRTPQDGDSTCEKKDV